MNTDNQQEMYLSEFEPDANEIMFGRRTAPHRLLTEKEVAKRKKIILKLVDQKLKFELIELMKRQLTNTSNAYTSPPDPPAPNHSDTQSWTVTCQFSHHRSYYQQQNWQPGFENVWQPSVHRNQYETGFFAPLQNRIKSPIPSFPRNVNLGNLSSIRPSTSFPKNMSSKTGNIPPKMSTGKVSTSSGSSVTSTPLCSVRKSSFLFSTKWSNRLEYRNSIHFPTLSIES